MRGQNLMEALCAKAEIQELSIGLYGGESEAILNFVKMELTRAYPNLSVVYAYSPPFRPLTENEDAIVVQQIKESRADILFVGIGCPKQEKWMFEHKEKLSCVMIGVGAAFDFISGNKRHAPLVLQSLGLEWLFRLCNEPKRLGSRYLKNNPRFVLLFLQQLIFKRKWS